MSFNANVFKREVKLWMRNNPQGDLEGFVDFCESLIPPQQFTNYQWLLDHTVDWYKHILAHREAQKLYMSELAEEREDGFTSF